MIFYEFHRKCHCFFRTLYMGERKNTRVSGCKSKISLIPKALHQWKQRFLIKNHKNQEEYSNFLLTREAFAEPKTGPEFTKIYSFYKIFHTKQEFSVLRRNYTVTVLSKNKILPGKTEKIQNFCVFSVCLTPSVSCQI